MGVSKNRGGPPKSSILIGLSIINFNKPSILGKIPLFLVQHPYLSFKDKFFRFSQVTGVPQLSIIHSFIDHHMPEGTCTSTTNDLLGCTNDTVNAPKFLQKVATKQQKKNISKLSYIIKKIFGKKIGCNLG